MTTSFSSVSSSVGTTAPVQQPKQAERVKEVENDKDKDDSAAKTEAQAAPRPTVNTSGQVVGSIINTQA